MGKMQISVPAADKDKAEVAAHFSGLAINEAVEVGGELTMDVTYRSGNQLVKFGGLLKTVKGNELEALKQSRAEKAAKEEKKK